MFTLVMGLQRPRPQGKGPNSNFKIQFLLNAYHYHTIIKSKNCKLNHPTSVKTVWRSLLPGSPPLGFSGRKETAASHPCALHSSRHDHTHAHTPSAGLGDGAVLPPGRAEEQTPSLQPAISPLAGCYAKSWLSASSRVRCQADRGKTRSGEN